MIETIDSLKILYKDYVNVNDKISREVKRGNLFYIKRGLYETDKNANPFYIANVIIVPSYISFETALYYYGLIPERVNIIMSASFKMNKHKEYKNYFGKFYYIDINADAYPYGIDAINIDNKIVFIASKEKAILDTLSKISPRRSVKEVKDLLFDDLRFNEYEFDNINTNKLIELSTLYKGSTFKYLRLFLGGKHD